MGEVVWTRTVAEVDDIGNEVSMEARRCLTEYVGKAWVAHVAWARCLYTVMFIAYPTSRDSYLVVCSRPFGCAGARRGLARQGVIA